MADRLRDRIAALFEALGSTDDSEFERARIGLLDLLHVNRKNFSDLAELVRAGSAQLWPTDAKLRKRMASTIAMLGAPTPGERCTAQLIINGLLKKDKKTWADLVSCCAQHRMRRGP